MTTKSKHPSSVDKGELLPVTVPRELFDFLMGSGQIDGTGFGDLNDRLPGRFWWRALMRTAEANQAHSLPGDVGMREALTDIFAAWDAHVVANDRTNEAIPPMGATRAEREVYAERYKVSEEAKRGWFAAMHRFVNNPATRAALTPSALSGDAGEDALREALAEAYRKGATDVHSYWVNNPGEPPQGDPEFGEAASDYAEAALDLFDSSARAALPPHQGTGEP